MVAVEADMSNPGSRDKAKNSLYHAKARSKDRYKGQLFSADVPSVCGFEGRRDREGLEREVNRCFIRHQHRNLVNELLENLCWSLAAAHYRQLVLNEWMPDNCECRKLLRALDHSSSVHPSVTAQKQLKIRPLTASNLLSFRARMKEYQAVVVKLTRHTREDEDTVTDLLNERSRGGWEPALMSQDEQRLIVLFQRSAVAEG